MKHQRYTSVIILCAQQTRPLADAAEMDCHLSSYHMSYAVGAHMPLSSTKYVVI